MSSQDAIEKKTQTLPTNEQENCIFSFFSGSSIFFVEQTTKLERTHFAHSVPLGHLQKEANSSLWCTGAYNITWIRHSSDLSVLEFKGSNMNREDDSTNHQLKVVLSQCVHLIVKYLIVDPWQNIGDQEKLYT